MTEQIEDNVDGFHLDFRKQSVIQFIQELEKRNDLETICNNASKSARDFEQHYDIIKEFL